MESEKVKEIKKALELNEYYAIEYFQKSSEPKIFTFTDLLTLINELESENERLLNQKWDKEDDLDNYHEENKRLKDRIAELEKEKNCVWEEWTDGDHSIWCCSNCKEDFCFMEGDVYENNYGYCPHCGAKITALKELQEDNDIDETLKELFDE